VDVTGFDNAVALRRTADHAFGWTVPDGWRQGRGAWGGLVVGALVQAVAVEDPAPVRSVSVQISAPAVVGEHRVDVALVRRGTAMSTWRASITGASGEVVASMVAITGGPRSTAEQSATWGTRAAPDLPPVERTPVLSTDGLGFPDFAAHCEYRPVDGIPMSGAPARCSGWVRLRQDPEPSAAWLVGLVDAWWPASLPALGSMVRLATVNFTANLLVDPTVLDPAQPLAYSALVAGAADGFTSEHRALWTSDGRLAVDNVQTIVVG